MFKIKILIVLISWTIIYSCKSNEETPTVQATEAMITTEVKLTEAQFKNTNLQTSEPEKMLIGHKVTLNGKIEVMPEHTITISSPMAGFIKQLKLIPGMNVSKGQTLVRLEDKEFIQLQQDYLSAKNTLYYAKLDLERQAELAKNQAASDKVWQLAEEKVKQTQITLRSLGEKLKFIHINPATLTADNMTSQITISAPSAGTITDVVVNNGTFVQAGDEVVQMLDHTGSRLVLKAFEKDLPFLKKGQKISAYSNTQPNVKIAGEIAYITNKVGQEGFANVICTLSNTHECISGMYLNANIEAQSMESWTLPDEAIISFEGREYVFVDQGNFKYSMVEVQTGQKEGGKVQIINNQIFIGKSIVVKGAYTLLMKMKNVAE